MRLHRTAVTIIATLCLAGRAAAAVQSYEGFDYPNTGSNLLVDSNGGMGWDGAWRFFGTVTPTNETNGHRLSQDDVSLDSAAFPFTPLGDRVVSVGIGPGNNTWADRNMASTLDMNVEGNVRYFSFLLQKDTGPGTSGDNMEFNLWSAGVGDPLTRLRFGVTSAERFFLHRGENVPTDGSANFDATVSLNQTYFMVLKIESHATTDDAFSVMTFLPTETVPVQEPVAWEKVHNVGLGDSLAGVRLWIGNAGSGQFDEIRIGDTWADVAVGGAPIQTGDFNNDGDVDGADFLDWQRGFGIETEASRAQGDGNGDQAVDELDFGIWKNQFGGPGVTAIPEPAGAAMAIAMLAAWTPLAPPVAIQPTGLNCLVHMAFHSFSLFATLAS